MRFTRLDAMWVTDAKIAEHSIFLFFYFKTAWAGNVAEIIDFCYT